VRVSPVVSPDGIVAVASDKSFLYGFDESSGNKLWEYDAPNYIHYPPAFGEDGFIYLECNDWTLYALQSPQVLVEKEVKAQMVSPRQDAPRISQDGNIIDIAGVKLDVRA